MECIVLAKKPNVVGVLFFAFMAEEAVASGSSPSEGENAMFSALLTINTNISTMHNDINNLMVDDGQLDLDSIVTDRRAGDEGETNVGREGEEHASVVSEF